MGFIVSFTKYTYYFFPRFISFIFLANWIQMKNHLCVFVIYLFFLLSIDFFSLCYGKIIFSLKLVTNQSLEDFFFSIRTRTTSHPNIHMTLFYMNILASPIHESLASQFCEKNMCGYIPFELDSFRLNLHNNLYGSMHVQLFSAITKPSCRSISTLLTHLCFIHLLLPQTFWQPHHRWHTSLSTLSSFVNASFDSFIDKTLKSSKPWRLTILLRSP